MKFTAIILLAGCLQVSASSFSQNITLREKKIPLLQLLHKIEKQTGYSFFYMDEALKGTKAIDVDIRDLPLSQALDIILKDQPLNYSIEGGMILFSRREEAGENTLVTSNTAIGNKVFFPVKGVVRGPDNKPVGGITVMMKNATNRGTVTDNNGVFLVNASEGDIIVFSGIGYETKEVKVSPGTDMTVFLNYKRVNMDGVTVLNTGYQSLLKERAPGAFSQVDQDVLSKRPVSNISTALQGMVSGMQGKENADGSVTFLVRGSTSLYADRAPLVVVDGFPVANSDFSTINPNDVESVTVLKDAAAASVWGARSANGVIVITTKKGKTAKLGLQIEGKVFTRIAKSPDLRQLTANVPATQMVDYERLAFQNHWIGTSEYGDAFPTDLSKPLTLAQELLYANKAGRITTATMNNSLDSLRGIDNRDQVDHLLLRKAILTQYSVSFAHTSDRSRSYASLLFEDNNASYQGTGYNRYGINFSNDYKIAKWIAFNFGLYLQYNKSRNNGVSMSELQGLSPYETLLNADGGYSAQISTKNRYLLSQLPLASFPYPDWSFNLLREVRGRDLSAENWNARIQTGFTIKILQGLTLETKLQYEREKTEVKNFYSDDTYYVRDLVNTYVEYNNTTKTVGRVFLPKGGIEQSNTSDGASYVFRNQLNFVKDVGTKHSINAIAGMEMSQYRTNARTNPWLYGYFPDKLQSTVPVYGYGSSVDVFTTVSGGSGGGPGGGGPGGGPGSGGGPGGAAATLSGGNTTLGYGLNRYLSYYANAAYTYNNRYTLSGSVRSDASNFITRIPSLRWEPLWSIGALWNIKEEAFAGNIQWLDRLALRATYGVNGNIEKSTSTNTLVGVSTSPNTSTGTIVAVISDNGNPTLGWERTTTTNIGIDFSFFNNKLFGKVDLYNKIGTNITGVVALPAATGTNSQKFNNAGITNRGIEIDLGTQVSIPGTRLTYSINLTYAYNKNTVNDLYYPAPYASQMLDPGTTYIEGRPVNPVYSFTYAGTINAIPQVAGPKGAPYTMNSTALTNGLGLPFLNYEGTTTPPHTAGWYSTFGYNNFSLSVLFIGKFGGVYRNNTFNYASATVGSGKTRVNQYVSDVFAGRADIPPFARPNESQLFLWDRYVSYLSGLVASSSYIECKEVMFGYDLPRKLLNKARLRNIKIYAELRDLGLIWSANKDHYNSDWLPGTNRPLATYTVGLNMAF